MAFYFIPTIILFLASQFSSQTLLPALMTLEDNTTVLAKFEKRIKTKSISLANGRRQDDEYFDDEYEEYGDRRDTRCKTNAKCGFYAICDKELEICVCREIAFGTYPRCCRQRCQRKRRGICDPETRRCSCRNKRRKWRDGCKRKKPKRTTTTRRPVELRPVSLRPVVNTPPGTLILTLGGVSYYRVSSLGLTDGELVATCRAAGLTAWCHGPHGCQYNSHLCKVTSLSTQCGNPGWPISKYVCGGNTYPYQCQQTQNLNLYMNNWNGASSWGITTTTWGIQGRAGVPGHVLCVT